MIYGIGTDLARIERFEALHVRWGLDIGRRLVVLLIYTFSFY